MNLLALPTLLDPRMKKLAFSSSVTARQGEQGIVQKMKQHVPAVPVPTNEHTAVRAPEQDVGL